MTHYTALYLHIRQRLSCSSYTMREEAFPVFSSGEKGFLVILMMVGLEQEY